MRQLVINVLDYAVPITSKTPCNFCHGGPYKGRIHVTNIWSKLDMFQLKWIFPLLVFRFCIVILRSMASSCIPSTVCSSTGSPFSSSMYPHILLLLPMLKPVLLWPRCSQQGSKTSQTDSRLESRPGVWCRYSVRGQTSEDGDPGVGQDCYRGIWNGKSICGKYIHEGLLLYWGFGFWHEQLVLKFTDSLVQLCQLISTRHMPKIGERVLHMSRNWPECHS